MASSLRRRSGPRLWAVALLATAAAGCGGSSGGAAAAGSGPSTATAHVVGQVRLASYTGGAVAAEGRLNYDFAGGGCVGSGEFASIRPGQTVEVADNTGRVVGTAALGKGDPSAASACVFDFATDVASSKFYRFTLPGYPPVTVDRATATGAGARILVTG